MRLAPTEVYEVATFYHHFDVVKEGVTPPPPLTVRVCDSLSCELAGARELMGALTQSLGAAVRVLPAPCVGRCEQAPVAVVGRNPIACATAADVESAVAAGDTRVSRRGLHRLTSSIGRRAATSLPRSCVRAHAPSTRKRQQIESAITAMEGSGLRGLGGAGFPAGRKWRIVRAEPAPRLMAVNIDEGEPGTFKDRYYLERDPHRFLEGALIAAWAVEAAAIYIYLRDEYAGCREILERELAALTANPPCALPPIHLRRGAGAYICGEESAMIESIEGKRGMPRLRPPYVAQVGLFGRPTLEHNMETLYWVRDIIEKGAGLVRLARPERPQGPALVLGIGPREEAGRASRAAGITVKQLIDEYCGGMLAGHTFYAYLPGGASGGILPASLGRRAARFRHAAAARLLHRLGGGDHPVGQGPPPPPRAT